MKDKGKLITDKEVINKLISLDETSEDNRCDKETFIFLFGKFNGKRRCNTYDYIDIPPDSYGPKGKRNKNTFRTTCGRFFFNKLFIEPNSMFNVFGYINETLNSKNIKKITKKMGYATLEGDLKLEDAKEFFDKFQWLTTMCMLISKNDSEESIKAISQIANAKKKLLEKYKNELEQGDEATMIRIEKELLDYAKSVVKETDMNDIYESGICSYENHLKDLYVIKGMAKDPDPSKGYHFIKGSYMDGMDKDDYVKLLRTQASGPYARGSLTQTGGAMEKEFVRAFNHISFEKDTDCGTNKYIEVVLTDSNIHKFMYSYIIKGSKLELLTSKNVNEYLNKKVKIRFSSTCKRTKNGSICNKCMGELPNMLGITNIGLLISNLGSSCKNSQMKAFHDGQVSTYEMNPMSAFGF